MTYTLKKYLLLSCSFILLFCFSCSAIAQFPKGIYVNQTTLEDTPQFKYLINRAKQVGINTFVVDLELRSKKSQQNLQLLKENNIKYIARIIVFPNGGTAEQIRSEPYWEKRYKLVQAAIEYGAEEIQLDYIRYSAKQPAASRNSEDIYKIIQWYKNKLSPQKIPLQIDVFGIASFGESKHIGQNMKMFSESVDTMCPMVYPSHYEPFRIHAVTPYETVLTSLKSVKKQFNNNLPFKLNPYIELSNYRYPLSKDKKLKYIYAQIRAVQDAGADGWYAWSPNNLYDNLFEVMSNYPVK